MSNTKPMPEPKDTKSRLLDPYQDNPKFTNEEEGKLYIRLPESEKFKIKGIHPRDNTYQVVINSFWFKLCRKCEQLGLSSYNDVDDFIRLVNEFEIGGKVVTELKKKKNGQTTQSDT